MLSALTLGILGAFFVGTIYAFFITGRRGRHFPPGRHSPAGCPDRVDLVLLLQDLQLYPSLGTFIKFQKVERISSGIRKLHLLEGIDSLLTRPNPDSQNGPRNTVP